MLNSFRHKIGKLILERKLKTCKREKAIFNFNSSHKIGIVFKTNSTEDYELVKEFIHFLKEQKNEITAIGYIENKKFPDYHNTPLGCSFFSKNDLNFFSHPNTPELIDFINKPFEILIDLTTKHYSPLNYISNLSKAKFKIGRYQLENNCYDLMIDLNKPNTVKSLIEQIKHYVPIFCESPEQRVIPIVGNKISPRGKIS